MSNDEPKTDPAQYPEAVRKPALWRRYTIWFVPLLVLIVCAYLIDRNVIATGPAIDIAFTGDVPVEPQKTPLKYKGVEIGRVEKLTLSHDLKYVIVHVQLEKFADKFADQGAQFWVVRPQINSSGVHGIETLTSGSYIEALPGKGVAATTFLGLPEDPEYSSDPHALSITLVTDHIGKLRKGAAVQYRGVDVGQVNSIDLDETNDDVIVTLFVKGPFRNLVNSSSRFSYFSGIEANFGLSSGAKLQIASLPTLLNGAIQFVTPDKRALPLNTHIPQRLLDPDSEAVKEAEAQEARGLKLELTASKVTKLSAGSLVQYRGISVGQVDDIKLNKNSDTVTITISVNNFYRSLVNSSTKFWYTTGFDFSFGLLSGAKFELSTLPVLLNGAIDFTTPDKNAPALHSKIQPLHEAYDKKWDEGKTDKSPPVPATNQ